MTADGLGAMIFTVSEWGRDGPKILKNNSKDSDSNFLV